MLPRLAAVLLLASGGLFVGGVAMPTPVSAVAPAGATRYVPIAPTRVADTRPGLAFGFTMPALNTYRVPVTGLAGVPLDATAVVVSVTAMAAAGAGSVAVYPAGDDAPTEADVVVDVAGQSITNTVHVLVGIGGAIELKRSVAVYLGVDVIGAYVPVDDPVAAGRMVMPASALRIASAVPVAAGAEIAFDLASKGVPTDATGVLVAINSQRSGKGIWAVYRHGTRRPTTATLTIDTAGQSRSNQTIVPLNGTSPIMRIYTSGGGAVSVDVLGWFTGASATPSTDGLFIPTAHRRQLDTRIGRSLPPFGPATFEFSTGTTESVMAVVGNVWTADSWAPGNVRATPAGTAVPAITIAGIATARASTANHFLARVSSRGIAVTTNAGAHMMIDVADWYLGTPPTATLTRVTNRTFAPTKVTQVRWTDAGGTKVRDVRTPATSADQNLDRIADLGLGAAYKDHSTLGQRGNVMIFGHRTLRGAMFRYLHTVKLGAVFSLRGADGRWYHYQVTHVGVTSPTYTNIARLAGAYPPATAQLVACSKLNGLPTSLQYRIVVTGRLIGVS